MWAQQTSSTANATWDTVNLAPRANLDDEPTEVIQRKAGPFQSMCKLSDSLTSLSSMLSNQKYKQTDDAAVLISKNNTFDQKLLRKKREITTAPFDSLQHHTQPTEIRQRQVGSATTLSSFLQNCSPSSSALLAERKGIDANAPKKRSSFDLKRDPGESNDDPSLTVMRKKELFNPLEGDESIHGLLQRLRPTQDRERGIMPVMSGSQRDKKGGQRVMNEFFQNTPMQQHHVEINEQHRSSCSAKLSCCSNNNSSTVKHSRSDQGLKTNKTSGKKSFHHSSCNSILLESKYSSSSFQSPSGSSMCAPRAKRKTGVSVKFTSPTIYHIANSTEQRTRSGDLIDDAPPPRRAECTKNANGLHTDEHDCVGNTAKRTEELLLAMKSLEEEMIDFQCHFRRKERNE